MGILEIYYFGSLAIWGSDSQSFADAPSNYAGVRLPAFWPGFFEPSQFFAIFP
ncbi:hypothetical protein [Cytobacillus sp. AMY 15.2]|uniref:hypothetical protein n=1 Tax=Cytobacillus sp. AMY 15.2 TaxID=2939563 RepID=UPI0020417C3A|nr:hypothetical protein [Cytobacillus sp. AMY 15.2]